MVERAWESVRARRPLRRFARRFAPWILAASCAVWGLRTAGNSEPIFPDASRFAMNGALLLDMVRDRAVVAPVQYAEQYYARLPALSIPYHPPLFPLFEALLYSALGVGNLTARLAIAFTVALVCLLLYRLISLTHGSGLFAASVVLVFFAMPTSQWLASEIMLEFPSLVFVLAALLCLRETGHDTPRFRPFLWFALWGIAAVWTKQQAVFLVGVPFVYMALLGHWAEFRRKPIWVSTGILTSGAALMYMLSRAANADSSTAWGQTMHSGVEPFLKSVWNRLVFYARGIPGEIGLIETALLAVAAIGYILLRKRYRPFGACHLYIATILSSIAFLVFMPFRETRYLFYTFPAIALLACTPLQEAGIRLCSRRYAWTVPAVFAVLAFAIHQREPPLMMGPSRAAQFVVGANTRRVLYCGLENGSFIFAVRAVDPHPQLAVIRGDKLAGGLRSREELLPFLKKYGIERVVLESHPSGSAVSFCEDLARNPPPQLVPEREVPITANAESLRGRIRIYRVPEPASSPEDILILPSSIVKGGVRIDLRQAHSTPSGGE